MADEIVIYGKAGCPFTDKAISAYGKGARYIDVEADSGQLQIMLKLTNGVRQVPVIVEGGRVTIGYGGVGGVGIESDSLSELKNPKDLTGFEDLGGPF